MTQPPQNCTSHLLPPLSDSSVHQLFFLDPAVDDPKALLRAIAAEDTVIRLQAQQDGIAQITTALAQNHSVSTVHIIAQGSPACLRLGSSLLNLDTLDYYAWDLQTWFSTLPVRSPWPTLFLYGSNVADGEAGAKFLNRLHQLTHAAIAVLVKPTDSSTPPEWQTVCAAAPSRNI